MILDTIITLVVLFYMQIFAFIALTVWMAVPDKFDQEQTFIGNLPAALLISCVLTVFITGIHFVLLFFGLGPWMESMSGWRGALFAVVAWLVLCQLETRSIRKIN